MRESNGIFVADDQTISRVYCMACDEQFQTPETYHLSRHTNSAAHKGTVAEYNKMIAANEIANYNFPYDAARCRYKNRSLFDYFSNNYVEDMTITIVDDVVDGRRVYKCRCFCSLCQKDVAPNLYKVRRHAEKSVHKRDSKGFSEECFNQDICALFSKRKYVVYVWFYMI